MLFLHATAMHSSPGLSAIARIFTPFVGGGLHFLIKSYGYFPVVELFSSDRTQSPINPLSDERKNPFEYGLIQETCIKFSSELNALSTYYFNSKFSRK